MKPDFEKLTGSSAEDPAENVKVIPTGVRMAHAHAPKSHS